MNRESRIIPNITRRRALGILGAIGFTGLGGINIGQAVTANDRVNSINNEIDYAGREKRVEFQKMKPSALKNPSWMMTTQERKDSDAWDNKIAAEEIAAIESATASHKVDMDIHKRSRLVSAINSLFFLGGIGLSGYYAASERNKKSLISVNEFVAPLRNVLGRFIPSLNPVLREEDALTAAENIIRSSQDKKA